MNLADSMRNRSSANFENLRIVTWKRIEDAIATQADAGKRMYLFSLAGYPKEVKDYIRLRGEREGFTVETTSHYITFEW